MRLITAAVLSFSLIVMILAGCVIVPIPAPDTAGISDPIPINGARSGLATGQPVTKRLDNLAIVGVTSALSPFSQDEQQRYGSELTRALQTAHPGYTLLSYNDVGTRLGDAQQQRLLDALRFSGNLNPEHLSTLKPLSVHYVVLARLERDTLRYAEGQPELTDSQSGSQRRNVTGKVGLNTERTIVLTFMIYDLDEQKLIWQGNGEAKRTYSDAFRYSYTGDDSANIDLSNRLQTNLNDKTSTVYPQEETLETLMRLAFTNFAKQIPQTL